MVLLIPPLTNELTKILDIWSFYIFLTVPSLPLQKLYFNTKVPFLPNSIPIHCFSWMQRNFKVYTLGIRKDRCCPLPSSPNSSHFKVENWKLQIQRIQLMGLLFFLLKVQGSFPWSLPGLTNLTFSVSRWLRWSFYSLTFHLTQLNFNGCLFPGVLVNCSRKGYNLH